MGRKSQGKYAKQQSKTKNEHNLSTAKLELNTLVDKLLQLSTTPNPQTVSQALALQREISAVIDKIKPLESKLYGMLLTDSVDKRDDSATIDAFLKWVVDNGAYFKNIDVAVFPGYDLGLKATTDIPQHSLMIAVPRKLMLTSEGAKKSSLGSLVERDQILKNMPNVALALFLLVEKVNKDSFWKPYIDILPKSYNTILYFTMSDLEELHGSPTLDSALKQIKSITRQYAYFYKLFNASDDPVSKLLRNHFTYSMYCWAVSTIMTRQNTVPSEDGELLINALIPLWDLCNHTNGTISTNYNPVLDRSECLALKNFQAGEQLFIFYGARSNADLFIHNGFVYEDNLYDGYYLHLGISKSDALKDKRTEVLTKLQLSNNNDFWIQKGPQPVDGKLLAFTRVFTMNEEQLQHWLESDKCGDLQYPECALDTELEKKSWKFLQARLKLLLSTYKTTLDEDLKLIASEQASSNKILAIRMRATEKRILKEAFEYVEQYIGQ